MKNKHGVILNKQLFTLVFLFVSGLCFSQQRVIGAIPCSDTGKLYNVQVGAFRVAANAEKTKTTLRGLGLTPGCEQYGDLTRVFAAGISFSGLRDCLNRLENAGFREVIIRESLQKAPVNIPPLAVDTSPEYPDDTTATVPPAVTSKPIEQRTILLCRSWRSQTLDGENIQGTEADHVLRFATDGTYSITYLDTNLSAQGQWKWKEDGSQDILITWDSWNTTAESVIEVTDTQLRMWQDSGTKRIWESVPQ